MPTLIAMQGMTPRDGLPGQDLMSPGYRERLHLSSRAPTPSNGACVTANGSSSPTA